MKQADSEAVSNTYRSFLEVTRWVLDVIERELPDVTPFLAQLDRTNGVHRIVDVRQGDRFDLRPNATLPLTESLCIHMAADESPHRSNVVQSDAVYGTLELPRLRGIESYLGVPIELFDTSRVASLAAYANSTNRFGAEDERLFEMLARVLAAELEREAHQHDLRELTTLLREQANGMATIAQVANALALKDDGLRATALSACEIANANRAFILMREQHHFICVASSMEPTPKIKIVPRDSPNQSPFAWMQSYFIEDAIGHPALDPGLVSALKAKSMLFEPIVRDHEPVAVLLITWDKPIKGLSQTQNTLVRLLCLQGAAAVSQHDLENRLDNLAISDTLTGVASKRMWDEQLSREIERSKRSGQPLTLALLDIDALAAFNSIYGNAEGDRLIKESAAAWSSQLRSVDYIARITSSHFGVLLPGCDLQGGTDVINRLRRLTPRTCTTSAGIASWQEPEPLELLVARTQQALLRAKEAGGDQTAATD